MLNNTELLSKIQKSERVKFGLISGFVGVFANLILSVSKIIIGFLFASLSIMADGFNNLSDMASSIVSLVGFKLSKKPADEKHPFGHARIEYVSGLVISFIIIFLGLMMGTQSVKKIMDGGGQDYSLIAVGILCGSIVIKLFLGVFNYKLSKKINSPTIKAVAVDSFNDSIATTAVLASLLIANFAGVQLDGYIGIFVSIIILISGIKTLSEMLSPLLGERIDPNLKNEIENSIRSYDGVIGVHDLIVHSYGAKTYFASAHVEMNAKIPPLSSHEVIDTIEKDFQKQGLKLVLHYDPVEIDDERVQQFNQIVCDVIQEVNPNLKIHDFRVVFGKKRNNLIFDLVVPYDRKFDQVKVVSEICSKVKERDKSLCAVIEIDREY